MRRLCSRAAVVCLLLGAGPVAGGTDGAESLVSAYATAPRAGTSVKVK